MKILKIDHLGIAVNSIDAGKNFWTDGLGLSFQGTETVAEQKVTTAFLPVGESEVELLESTAPDGPIAKYLEKKGEGIQHVAFRVANLDEALAELKAKGVQLIDQKPRARAPAARGSPSSTPRPPTASWWSCANEAERPLAAIRLRRRVREPDDGRYGSTRSTSWLRPYGFART